MKKNMYKIVAILALSLFLGSCDDNDSLTTLSPDTDIVATLSASSVSLSNDSEGTDVLTVNFSEPEFGFKVPTSYRVALDIAGGDFSNAVNTTSGIANFSKTFENNELNDLLLDLDAEIDVETQLILRVDVILSPDSFLSSEPIPFTATPFASIIDVSSIWGIVGDATPNAWDGPDLPFYKTNEENVFVAYVTLVDGAIKFRTNNAWVLNYGDATADGVLDQDNDNNINVSAGTYKIDLNINNLTYAITELSWGLVGDATPNGWDGPDVNLEYDPFSNQWRKLVSLTDGGLKFRQNNDWSVNYGDLEPNNILDTQNDNNINITAGNYLVSADFEALTYSIVETDIWGVVGDATPNGWDGPDTKFSIDFSTENIWILKDIVLTDGAIKFRTNDAWDLNYGDLTADGVLDQDNDNNINVTAGTYDIILDFNDLNAITYELIAK